jgi:APA family basic amino acid/polyamine antiporter
VAGEIRKPERNIPRSVIYGTVIVTSIYVLINAAYLYAMPPQKMKGIVNAGEIAAQLLLGGSAGRWVSAAILIMIFGAINSVILTAPRIYYAMAQDGLFFRAAGVLHPRHKTPVNSILLQAVWSCMLVVLGTFDQLLTYTSVSMLAFSIMTAAGIFILRKARPDIRRPYLMPGYPWVPILFIGAYALILLYVIVSKPWESLAGLGIMAFGVLWYHFWKSRDRNGHAVQTRSAVTP